jgi:hypothetical protein
MDTIGVLDHSRLTLIPPKYWKAHEFCFFLHDNVLNALVEYEQSGAHNWVTDAFEGILKDQQIEDEFDILKFMKERNIVEPYKHHLLSHLVLGLVGDMLNFLYEAFSAFEKRKFAVGWSLLRKPLKENLLFLSWILADEDEFIEKFESDNYKTLNNIKKEKQIEIFDAAIKKIPNSNAFNGELLWDHIYSKNHSSGFEPTWQRATHLITSQGDLLKTEDYTINLIFESPYSNHHYELLYERLPYVMIYLSSIAFECFNRILKMNERTYNHMEIISMGCYEALFMNTRYPPLISSLNKSFKPFLKCIHCHHDIKINKKNAPAMYISDQLVCNKCGLQSAFPFYWLMGQSKITVSATSEKKKEVSKK